MLIYNTILQGSEATEENAINFALSFDFSECETEEYTNDRMYIDTFNGIDVYYQYVANYYFFAPEPQEEYNHAESDQFQFYPPEY